MSYDAVPAELKARPQWVTWRFVEDPKRPEKPKKVPYNAITGKRAQSNNPATWTAFEAAVAACEQYQHNGVGFVFSPSDPYVGIDLDDCITDDGVATWAQTILDTMQSYSEVSPSGLGIKLIVAGHLPNDEAVKTEHIEIYGKGRYFTITGQHVVGTPTVVRNVNGELARLVEATRPAVTAPALPALDARPAAPDYLREWADRLIDEAVSRVALAAPNTYHNTRLDMARWVGGLIPHGLADADTLARRLYQARVPQSNHRDELHTIHDGLRLGAAAPLGLPEPPPQPLFDSHGVAHCPVHRVALPRAKNGNGYKCHQKDASTATGWCDFWWKGDGYVVPSTITERTGQENGDAVGSGATDRHEGITSSTAADTAKALAHIVDGAYGSARPATLGDTPRFVLYSLEALRDLPPVTWLLDGEIPAQLMTVVCGPSGAGKSLLMVDYAIRVARRYADSAVIYVAAEGGSGYRARVEAWLAHYKISAPDNLHFIIREVPVLEPLAIAELVTLLRPINPALVIFDTLARCMVGGDENSAKDMGLFVRGCDTIRQELGCAVAVVHHAGKSGAYRGSSALYAAADSWIDVANDDGLISVLCGKAKDWKPFNPRYLRMAEVADSIVLLPSDQVPQREGVLTEGQRRVLEALALDIFQEAGAKRAELVSATSITDATMYKVLSHLKRAGYISQSKKGDPYFITAGGLAAVKNYHRNLRQQNAQLSELSPTGNELSESSTTNYTTISLPVRGEREIVDSSVGESSDPTDDLFPEDVAESPVAGLAPEQWREVLYAHGVGNWNKIARIARDHSLSYTELVTAIRTALGGNNG
jgi:uncharacterized protein YjhX (UPF0386 family)